jgi:hypothetical protein
MTGTDVPGRYGLGGLAQVLVRFASSRGRLCLISRALSGSLVVAEKHEMKCSVMKRCCFNPWVMSWFF